MKLMNRTLAILILLIMVGTTSFAQNDISSPEGNFNSSGVLAFINPDKQVQLKVIFIHDLENQVKEQIRSLHGSIIIMMKEIEIHDIQYCDSKTLDEDVSACNYTDVLRDREYLEALVDQPCNLQEASLEPSPCPINENNDEPDFLEVYIDNNGDMQEGTAAMVESYHPVSFSEPEYLEVFLDVNGEMQEGSMPTQSTNSPIEIDEPEYLEVYLDENGEMNEGSSPSLSYPSLINF